MHRAFGEGSVCDAATVYGSEHDITVIDGGCPLMFDPTADLGQKVMGRSRPSFGDARSGALPPAR